MSPRLRRLLVFPATVLIGILILWLANKAGRAHPM